jgi:hypothetical protein
MPKTVEFRVSFPLPAGATVADAREYVDEAVTTWRGSLCPPGGGGSLDDDHPGDPMWGLDADRVKVTRLRRPSRTAARTSPLGANSL